MPWNLDLQNNNKINDSQYVFGMYEREKINKLILAVMVVFLAIIVIVIYTVFFSQDKETKSATEAARKTIPNAIVSNVKVAGGFALATVRDPDTNGQANSGSVIIFKVNKDGSMRQLASGSSFDPMDLLWLGISLPTQAKLIGKKVNQVELDLANQCGYSAVSVGFDGFDGSFNPGGWEIDATTLDSLEQKLSAKIDDWDSVVNPVVCVSTTQNNSNFSTDKTSYISTFTLQVLFITDNGTATKHVVTFKVGSGSNRIFTLDGKSI